MIEELVRLIWFISFMTAISSVILVGVIPDEANKGTMHVITFGLCLIATIMTMVMIV